MQVPECISTKQLFPLTENINTWQYKEEMALTLDVEIVELTTTAHARMLLEKTA